MTVNSVKKTGSGTATDKPNEAEFQNDAGTMRIKSTAVHNHIKNNVEDNLINFSLTNSLMKGSVETNLVKVAGEGNLVKATAQTNLSNLYLEANFLKHTSERYHIKKAREDGRDRDTKINVIHSKTDSRISTSESLTFNLMFERSYSINKGKRFTITVPPHLDVAIIDASNPEFNEALSSNTEEESITSGTAKQTNQLHMYADKELIDCRYEKPRATREQMGDLDETNFIYLAKSDLPDGVLKKLEKIPEWNDHEDWILNKTGFAEFLKNTASPKVAGFPEHFTPFKGNGLSVTQAQSMGATCRLQVSHGANQTIMVSSHSLRTIRFNGATMVDHGNVNLLYLGGKYEHIRGKATKLVEGSFVQHHRMPQSQVEDKDTKDAKVNYRFEQEASFAFVKPLDEKSVNEIWALQLREEGIDIGRVKTGEGARSFEYGVSVRNDQLQINHASQVKIETEGSIEFLVNSMQMKLDDSGFFAGDLVVRPNKMQSIKVSRNIQGSRGRPGP